MYLDQRMPQCENGCGNQAIRFTLKGKAVCSKRPAGCSAVRNKMQETSIKRYGVPNISLLPEIKELKSKSGIERIAAIPLEEKEATYKKIKATKDAATQKLIETAKHGEQTLTKKQYYKLVGKITEWNYRKHINQLDPDRMRGNDWHLDHMISRYYGFCTGIPAYIIGDINNLEMLPGIVNETKRQTNSLTADELFHRYNTYYESSKDIPFDPAAYDNLPKRGFFRAGHKHPTSVYTDELGKCTYCQTDAHYKYPSGKWCCLPHKNSCPSLREKNKKGHSKTESVDVNSG